MIQAPVETHRCTQLKKTKYIMIDSFPRYFMLQVWHLSKDNSKFTYLGYDIKIIFFVFAKQILTLKCFKN
jgi:hypothetical protein